MAVLKMTSPAASPTAPSDRPLNVRPSRRTSQAELLMGSPGPRLASPRSAPRSRPHGFPADERHPWPSPKRPTPERRVPASRTKPRGVDGRFCVGAQNRDVGRGAGREAASGEDEGTPRSAAPPREQRPERQEAPPHPPKEQAGHHP